MLLAARALCIVVAGCATTEPGAGRPLGQLDTYLKECTARHGYDPGAGSALGPNQLGPDERQWRECVYQGVEAHLIPNTFAPEAYRRAIATDRALTERVGAVQMTRAERHARIEALLENIDREEQTSAGFAMATEIRRQEESARMRDYRRTLIQPLGR